MLAKLLREGRDRGVRNEGAEVSNEEGKMFSTGLFSHCVTLVYLVIN